MAAAAAVVCAAVLSIVLWPVGSAAVVVAADNGLYRVVAGKTQPLKVGERVRIGQTVRSDGDASATLAFTDGARVEMRSMSEIAIEDASEGFQIRLNNGSVIVNTSKQEAGRQLSVATRDVTVPVMGVLLVKADDKGSSVGAIQGEVRVQPNQKLEDVAIQAEIGWSREAAAYLAMLHESLAQKLAAKQATPSAPRGASVPATPQFEEASIRPCGQDFRAPEGMRGGGSNSLRLSPGRLDALCMTPATLIRIAYRKLNNNGGRGENLFFDTTYGLGTEDGTRVRGGPDWVRTERYTIAAVTQGRTDSATLRGPMLLSLLESRFRLKSRVDSEEIPVWALKIAKGGLKLKPAEQGCFQIPPRVRPPDEAEMRQLNEARGAKPFCSLRMPPSFPNMRFEFVGGTMSQLADRLSPVQGLPALNGLSSTLGGVLVVNQTGIPDTEVFDFVLEFGADPEAFTEIQQIAGPLEPTGPLGPTIFEALGKLGLTLERSKGSREFIVIDRIERPSEN
jgi:uncharacterized protein (TIGR03435 family)